MTNLNSSATNPNGQPASLLPCPFCGGDAELHQTHHQASAWFAWCANGECPVKPMTNDYETCVEAMAVWNHRAERTCTNLDDDFDHFFRCSECDVCSLTTWWNVGYGYPNYCPNCGAKVVEK